MTPEAFHRFADLLPEPSLLLTGAGSIVACNRAAYNRLGLEGTIGCPLEQLVTETAQDLARFLRSCRRSKTMVMGSLTFAKEGGVTTAFRAEGAVIHPETPDSKALLFVRLLPKQSAAGQFVALNQRIDQLGKEIHRRKLAEERERREGERLRVTLNSIGDAVIVTDAQGLVTSLNPVAQFLTGWSMEQAIGRPLPEVFRIFNELTRDVVSSPVTKVISTGRVVGLGNHTILVAQDGTERPIDDSAAPILDNTGNVLGVVLVFRDVTEKRKSEARLRESEQKLQLLADTIPQLAWMARPDGHIFWYNRRWYEYTGTTLEQMEGWGWQSVHDLEVLPLVLERWLNSITSGTPFDMVFPLRGADGRFRPFLTRVNPLRNGDGQILYWFGTNTDISEIKRMEAALRDADRRKDEFLATLAHELRNPLAPICNSLQILKMPRVDPATAQRTKEMMERQVHHLVRLVDDLLDVSRVMRGKVELRKEIIELATVVARAVETAQPLIEAHGHQLTISMPEGPLLLNADPVRLTQVIGNLLTNASKYTEANGCIALSAERDGNFALVRIQDNGIGIAAEMLPHIFELFVQADYASTRSQGGLGIGLTLVKSLVEMHGGTVQARSVGKNLGSEFIIRLPLSDVELPQREAVAESAFVPDQSALNCRLLVIDDNKDAAESLAMLLRMHDYEVQVAHDGIAGLELARTFLPSMIFLDIGMPGMDGYEVARRIRREPKLKDVIVVALTGWGQPEDHRRSATAGFNHHLVKPAEPQKLERLLSELAKNTEI